MQAQKVGVMLPSFLIPIIGVIIVVIIAMYGFTTNGYFVHFVMLATPIGIFLVNRPTELMILILGLFSSGVMIPGLPAGMQVVHLLMVFFVGLTIARNIISKPSAPRKKAAHLALYTFLLLLGVIIYFRGLGLRVAGSGLLGGSSYIKLFFGAGFLFCAQYYTLTAKQWRRCLYMMLIGSTLPTLAQLVFMLSGGSIYQHFLFIQPYVYGLIENMVGQEGSGAYRFHGLAGVSVQLVTTGLILLPFRGFMNPRMLLLIVFCLGLGALSGFRISITENLATAFIFIMLSVPKGRRLSTFIMMAVSVILLLFALVPVLPHMPYPVQRAFSWMPLADISPIAKMDAAGSAQWRFDVWKYSLAYWKEFMWLGRGFTFHISEVQSLSGRLDMYLEAYLTHNYHSGPLSLLLDTGLPGLIIGTVFLALNARYATKGPVMGADPFLVRFCNVYRAKVIYGVFAYFFVFGDVRSSFISIFIDLTILESLHNTMGWLARKQSAETTSAAPLPIAPWHTPRQAWRNS